MPFFPKGNKSMTSGKKINYQLEKNQCPEGKKSMVFPTTRAHISENLTSHAMGKDICLLGKKYKTSKVK